jgi:hypothetical protein
MVNRSSMHHLLLGVTLSATLATAALIASPANAIANGSLDNSTHPYVGALTVVGPDGKRVLACTGTLISSTVLVTAAHCVVQIELITGQNTTDVSFDPNVANSPPSTCQLTNCYVSPNPSSLHAGTMTANPAFVYSSGQSYSTSVDSHDIAVVRFDQPVSGVTPAQLGTERMLDQMAASGTLAGAPVTDVGYGWTTVVDKSSANWSGSFDGQRRYAAGGFQALTTSDLKVSENPALGYGGACSHDSGGPAIVNSVVVAELSSLQGNQCDSTYDSYRLDTASARSFLSQFTSLP